MTPSNPNRRSNPSPTDPTQGHPGIAGLLSPIRAELHEGTNGFTLMLEPMWPADALAVLTERPPSPQAEVLIWAASTDPDSAGSSASAADGRGDQGPRNAGHTPLIVGAAEWPQLARLLPQLPDDLEAVVVDGIIEPSDARAIIDAPRRGNNPLAVELRATTAISMGPNQTLGVEARQRIDAANFVAESFRQYLLWLRGEDKRAAISRPEDELVDRLLDRTGSLQVRPIETEVYSSAVDIGVLTRVTALQPADTSIIYDIFANSWHGE